MPVLDHCVIIVGTSRGERESMSLSFFSLVLWHFAGGGGRGGVAFLHIINAAAQRLGQQLISFSTLSSSRACGNFAWCNSPCIVYRLGTENLSEQIELLACKT